jgi:L-alanine-DL-glutamate epimerase-like enolase superfamily enzyme
MVTLFTMHLLRAIPNVGKSIEGPDYYHWQEGLFTENLCEVSDVKVTINDHPDWGVEICREWLAKSRYQVSEFTG